MKSRENNYYNGIKDEILEELEKQNVDITEYLSGSIAAFSMNKEKYKIFEINNINELRLNIKEIQGEEIREKIISEYEKQGIPITRVVGGWRKVNMKLDEEIDKIESFVIQKYKIDKNLEKKGFVDLVYNKKGYRIAPKKVGRPTKEEKNIRLNIRISKKQDEKIKKYAAKFNLSISEAVREILDTGIIRSRFEKNE